MSYSYLKIFFIFLTINLFWSCKSIVVLSFEKQKVISGIPSGIPFYRYSLDIKTTKKVKFLDIQNIEMDTTLNMYSVINLKTHLQGNNRVFYNPGEYRLQYDLNYIKQLKESVVIHYSQNGRDYYLKKEIDVRENFISK